VTFLIRWVDGVEVERIEATYPEPDFKLVLVHTVHETDEKKEAA
jgi:hypothetical protein